MRSKKAGIVGFLSVAVMAAVLLSISFTAVGFGQEDPRIVPGAMQVATDTGDRPFVPGELIIRFKEAGQLQDARVAGLLAANGLHQVDEIKNLHIKKMAVAEGAEQRVAAALAANPLVDFAEPNYLGTLLRTPNDQFYNGYQWNMTKINAPQAWDTTTGSHRVIIATVDSGADYTHPDLLGNDFTFYPPINSMNVKLLPGYDFANSDPVAQDDYWHGTHVAGIAAAATNNLDGVAGVSWGARIMPLKACNSFASCSDYNVARAIDYAVDHGASVVNMSLGFDVRPTAIETAVNRAYSHNVVLVASAGNDAENGNPVKYPASFNHVISVGATDSSDTIASFSEHNSMVDVAAPGVAVLSTFWQSGNVDTYAFSSGTSMASPHVAGLAALVLSANENLSPDQVEQYIETYATDLGTTGRDDYYGYGRIDAANTISHVPAPAALNYYFPLYDFTGKTSTNNIMIANNGTATANAAIYVSGVYRGAVNVTPGAIQYLSFAGAWGPMKVVSTNGMPLTVTQRLLYNGAISEINAVKESNLSSHYYWPIYDQLSPGMLNWVFLANPDPANSVYYEVKIGGTLRSTGTLTPNGWAAPSFPGLMSGPVEVQTWTNSGKTTAAKVAASQRVVINNGSPSEALGETLGTAISDLSPSYSWSWYDNIGGQSWVVIANPNSYPVTYELEIGQGGCSASPPPGTACSNNALAAGGSAHPTFYNISRGPVKLRSWTDSSRAYPANLVASVRTLWGASIKEVPGYSNSFLASNYSWPWYDSISGYDWMMVSNPNAYAVTYEIEIGAGGCGASPPPGTRCSSSSIPAGSMVTPSFAPTSTGPVRVSAWTDSSRTVKANVMASQRVLIYNKFNELVGNPTKLEE